MLTRTVGRCWVGALVVAIGACDSATIGEAEPDVGAPDAARVARDAVRAPDQGAPDAAPVLDDAAPRPVDAAADALPPVDAARDASSLDAARPPPDAAAPPVDAAPDATHDATHDAAHDATPDAAPDAARDAAGSDAAPDATRDAAPPPPVDAGPDAAADAALDGGEIDAALPVGVPDLIPLGDRVMGTLWIDEVDFGEGDCNLSDGCLRAPGLRRVLRFALSTANIGTGDLHLGHPDNNPDLFSYNECRRRWDFPGYSHFELRDAEGELASEGGKHAYCLLDISRYLEDDPTVRRERQFGCQDQGISRGWFDTYASNTDCQWVDITDLPAGPYALRLEVNHEAILEELDYDNNATVLPVTLPGELDLTRDCAEGFELGPRRDCGWTWAEDRECVPGARLRVGCNDADGCGVGRCDGDPMIRACAGEQRPCYPAGALAWGDDACETSCPAVEVECPVGGRFSIWTAAREPGQDYVCNLDVEVTLPTEPCVEGAPRGLARECGWEVAPDAAVCEPGRPFRVGCNGSAGCEIGQHCEEDAMLRVCPGDAACPRAQALAESDDACGALCPSTSFVCPESGRVTVLTAPFQPGRPYACMPAILPE